MIKLLLVDNLWYKFTVKLKMEKELNNCGNTRKALYLRLYSVCLNYTIRAFIRIHACERGR